jgi:hypothetical protein
MPTLKRSIARAGRPKEDPHFMTVMFAAASLCALAALAAPLVFRMLGAAR